MRLAWLMRRDSTVRHIAFVDETNTARSACGSMQVAAVRWRGDRVRGIGLDYWLLDPTELGRGQGRPVCQNCRDAFDAWYAEMYSTIDAVSP
jgi:hypothetical protein